MVTQSLHKNNSKLVSVIIPVFNRARMLEEAVDSVLAQTYKLIEVIIVDDGSNDDTVQRSQSLAKKYSNVEFIRMANQGPALARQAGLDRARGEYIQYLDSDDLLLPDKFQQQVTMLSANPSADVVYCKQTLLDTHNGARTQAWMRTGETHETMFPGMLGGRLWGTPVPLYRRTVLDKAGPWAQLSNLEDWEYDCRVAIYARQLAYVNHNLVTIRRHNHGHYGNIEASADNKIKDKAIALRLIANHAKTANIDHAHLEYRKFIRLCFFTSRQAAGAGYLKQSQDLLAIAKTCSANNFKENIEYRLYQFLSRVFGWQTIAKLSAQFDRWRL